MERDIVEILRDLTLDWDGSKMPNGAESRVPVYCLELREAADKIEQLRGLLSKAQQAMPADLRTHRGLRQSINEELGGGEDDADGEGKNL